MKKMRRLTSFVLVLALMAAVLVFMPADTALAADGGDAATSQIAEPKFNGVIPELKRLDSDIEARLAAEGFVALQFSSESAFNDAVAAGYDELASKGVAEFEHPTGSCYIYLLTDISGVKMGSPKSCTQLFNLAGHTLEYTTVAGNCSGNNNVTYFDGTFSDSRSGGHGLVRYMTGTLNLAYIDCVISSPNADRPWSIERQCRLNLYAENSTFDIGGTCFAQMGFSKYDANDGTAKQMTASFSAIFKGCELRGTTMFRVQSKFAQPSSIYFDSECKIKCETLVSDNRADKSEKIAVSLESGAKMTAEGRTALEKAPLTLVFEEGYGLYPNSAEDWPDYPFCAGEPCFPDNPTAVGALAGNKWVCYSSEAEYLADWDPRDNTLDGSIGVVKDGNGASYDFGGDLVIHTGANNVTRYYYLFDDATMTPSNWNDQRIGVANNITVDCGGNTVTVTGSKSFGIGRFAPYNQVEFTVKNGALVAETTASRVFTLNDGATLRLENLTVTDKTEGSCFVQDLGGIYELENVALDIDESHPFAILRHECSAVFTKLCADSACTACANYIDSKAHQVCTRAAGGSFKNVDFTGSVLFGYEVARHTTSTTGKVIDLPTNVSYSFDGDCSFNAEGGLFSYGGTAYAAGSSIKFTVSDGALFSAKAWVSSLASARAGMTLDISGITASEDGAALGFVIGTADATVRWYDEHGALILADYYDAGEVPTNEYTPGVFGMFLGKPYLLSAGGWALTNGGEATVISAVEAREGEIRYYCAPDKTAAAVAVFADGSCTDILNAWESRHISREQLAAIPEGAYVKLYDDVGVSPGITDADATRMDNYATGIVFDLSGYTMVHLKEGESAKRWTPLDGVTLTFKNGTMQVIGEDNLIFSEANGGIIKLYDVDIVSDAKTVPVIELRSGRVEMHGGSIFSLGTAPISCNADSSAQTATLTLGLHGVDIDAGDNALLTVSVAKKADDAASISIVIDKNGDTPTTLSAGSLLSFGDMTALSRNTTLSLSVSDTYALLSGEAFVGAAGDIATWYDATSGGAVTDSAAEAENIKLAFIDYYTNRALSQIGSATLSCGVKMTADGLDRYAVAYGVPRPEGIEASLTLESDFDLNLYIPEGSNVLKIMMGDAVIFDVTDPATYELSEGVYRFGISGISPDNAATYIALDITYTDSATLIEGGSAELDFTVRAYYSVIGYAEDLLESADGTTEAKNAMRALLAYVRAAYDNFEGSGSPELLSRLDSLYTEYGAGAYVDSLAGDIRGDDSDFGAESGITAQFAIGSVTKLYISFPESVDYVITDAESGVKVAIGTGRACTVELPAYLLAETLEITVGDKSATFSFGEYADALMNDGTENASEDAVLRAMYAYGRAAKALRAAKA